MAAPAITLTANLQDLTGSEIGSTANPAKVCIALCGSGAQLPRIVGTSMIGRPGPVYLEVVGGTFTTLLWGNDVIEPLGTYYTVAILDGQGNVVQCSAYQLSGSGTFDLSNLTPLTFPNQNPQAQIFFGPPSIQVSPSPVNGSNTQFTFSAPATPPPLISVYVAGVYKTQGVDFTLAYTGSNSWTITMTTAPTVGPVSVLVFSQLPPSFVLQGMQNWNVNVLVGSRSYTLPRTPFPGVPFLLFRSGLLLQPGSPPSGSYTISGNVITFTDSGTEFGDTLYALYWSF
jgi:hypothetical protein